MTFCYARVEEQSSQSAARHSLSVHRLFSDVRIAISKCRNMKRYGKQRGSLNSSFQVCQYGGNTNFQAAVLTTIFIVIQ
jgi:hypothetical protein